MKCQRCHNTATLHITEVHTQENIEELHLCEHCAQKYLYETHSKQGGLKGPLSEAMGESDEAGGLAGQQKCSLCGLTFAEFRNNGRLGCPNDYIEFHAELAPLLENIHGETQHVGKTPRRLPQNKQTQSELTHLRTEQKKAISREDYEEAATIRDRIRDLEDCE